MTWEVLSHTAWALVRLPLMTYEPLDCDALITRAPLVLWLTYVVSD
jgi:hypothetical protein